LLGRPGGIGTLDDSIPSLIHKDHCLSIPPFLVFEPSDQFRLYSSEILAAIFFTLMSGSACTISIHLNSEFSFFAAAHIASLAPPDFEIESVLIKTQPSVTVTNSNLFKTESSFLPIVSIFDPELGMELRAVKAAKGDAETENTLPRCFPRLARPALSEIADPVSCTTRSFPARNRKPL